MKSIGAILALGAAVTLLAGCASNDPDTVEFRATSTGGVAILKLSIGDHVTTEELEGDWSITMSAADAEDAKLTVSVVEQGLDQFISCEVLAGRKGTGYVETEHGGSVECTVDSTTQNNVYP